jgi:hypothetical protein
LCVGVVLGVFVLVFDFEFCWGWVGRAIVLDVGDEGVVRLGIIDKAMSKARKCKSSAVSEGRSKEGR